MDRHFTDHPKHWLSEPQRHPSPTPSHASNGSSVDKVLYKDLVEMLPLVESLMDRRTNTSFTRRASVVYTKTPSKDSCFKKVTELKGRKTAQTVPTKKRRETGDNEPNKNINGVNQDGVADEFSLFSPSVLVTKDREELVMLREQVEGLQKKLLEKDEILKSRENSIKENDLAQTTINGLRRQLEEKDALIRSTHLHLSNAKIKVADKQSVLEKLEWEAKTSKQKVEKLQGELDFLNDQITRFMQLFETSSNNYIAPYTEEDDTPLDDPFDDPVLQHYFDQASHMLREQDIVEEADMQKDIEEARNAYLVALAAAKEDPSEESLAIATKFRLQLEAFILKPILA